MNYSDFVSAIRVLRSADVILSEDTRHSGKLLQYYNIKAQLVSYFYMEVVVSLVVILLDFVFSCDVFEFMRFRFVA